jgi:hypothetical protein
MLPPVPSSLDGAEALWMRKNVETLRGPLFRKTRKEYGVRASPPWAQKQKRAEDGEPGIFLPVE